MKKPKLHKTPAWLIILALPLVFFSCYPDGPQVTEDLDLVGTLHDPEFNFAAAMTYSMPDTVIHIIGEDDDPDDVDHSYDELILTSVETNMSALGYTREAVDTVNPSDVVMLVSTLKVTNASSFYDPGWWWGYWGWWPGWGGYPGSPGWGPGWGYGYPWGYPIGYSYSTGTVFIMMLDPTMIDLDNETIGAVWMAAINGLLSGNKSSAETRIREGVNQAFTQDADILGK